jgi:predicted RNA-binding Zn ribbon-like protein
MPIATVRDGLCLDYANTLSWRGSAAPTERLGNAAALADWAAGATGLDDAAVRELKRWSHAYPAAARLLGRAIAIREAIYRIFGALAAGDAAPDPDLTVLNRALADAPVLLAPVLWSAGDLIVRRDRVRIRQCANEKCLWLFMDESKSGTRRWCEMSSCGNRAKAHRHYLKIKGA